MPASKKKNAPQQGTLLTNKSTNSVPKNTEEVKPIATKAVLVNKDHVYQVGEDFYPSVTTVLAALAKGKGFDVWLQTHSQDQAKDILEEAGLSGSKVHKAIELMLSGKRVVPGKFIYIDGDGVEHKGLTAEECHKVSTFVRWWYEYRPKVLAYEKVVYSDSRKFAGTVDFIGSIKEGKLDPKSKNPDNELMFLIDWKTSSGIYASYEMQVAAYAQAETEMTGKKIDRIAILRLGSKHKVGYEFKVLDSIYEPYKSFLGVLEAWRYQNPNFGPRIIEVPLYFELPKVEQVEVKTIKKRTNANTRIKSNTQVAEVRSN